MGKEIFKLQGAAEKISFFSRREFYIIAYEKGLCIKSSRKPFYLNVDEILNIYIHDDIFKRYKFRTLMIVYKRDDIILKHEIFEEEFPGIIERIDELYKNEWKQYSRNYSDTVKWLIACIANVKIVWDIPINCFGLPYKHKENKYALERDWGITNKDELIDTCKSYYNGVSALNCEHFYKNTPEENLKKILLEIKEEIINTNYRSALSYDLWRLILLCDMGYTAGYFTYEEALEFALMAGIRIQELHDSWDDFFNSYILGYSYWFELDPNVKGNNAYKRKVAYEEISKLPHSPWEIPWDTELKPEWNTTM